MSLSLAQFHQRLAGDTLPPVTLVAGAEYVLVEEATDALRARARAVGYAEREVLDVDHRFDWKLLDAAGMSLSLFASRRLIDLRLPTGRPGKDGSAAIAAWCASPPPDTALLITCNEWSKAQQQAAWVRAVEKAGEFVPLWPLKPEALPRWIGARLRAKGIDADGAALTLLVERTEGNLLAAAQEVDKLAMLHRGRLDAATLGELVADSARFDVFKLCDAAFAGDAARALRVLAGLRAEGEELLRMLGYVLRQLELALRLASARDFAAQARAEHLWPERQQLFRSALRRGDASHWRHCLQRTGRIDRIVKGREAGDPWREFERLMLAIAQPRLAAALA
ncbi:MAG TPA: DNA polymerase III subunit delta [Rhodanobacteraceae bacterium]|nr:DNA polymerase III subunit delta [Rhodanobacteraceae bacterium]